MSVRHVAEISTLTTTGQSALRDLNNAYEVETSYLSAPAWRDLVGIAFSATCIDSLALLIALDQRAEYDNANFRWFLDRYGTFVYVDRIVVSEALRGTGAGRALYDHLFDRAAAAGHEWVVCEINVDPPNPGSDAFHEKMGFNEVGRAFLKERRKSVRYLAKDIRAMPT